MDHNINQNYEAFFRTNEPLYQRLLQELDFMIKEAIAISGIKIHSCGGRVKDLGSALEKVQRKAYSDPQAQIEDVVGYRIVCLFASDLEKLSDIVNSSFMLLSSDEKIEGGSDPATFGYMSNHYICRLKSHYSGPRYDSIKEITFEVQCRTLLMDAWANVSHYLAYKGDASIPEHLRRDFYALSGLFYVADKHFELFYGEAVNSAKTALAKAAAGSIDDDSVNLETVYALLRQLYPDREQTDLSKVSEFVEEIVPLGYTSLRTLKTMLEEGRGVAEAREVESPPGPADDPSPRYYDLGMARAILKLKDARYHELLNQEARALFSQTRRT